MVTSLIFLTSQVSALTDYSSYDFAKLPLYESVTFSLQALVRDNYEYIWADLHPTLCLQCLLKSAINFIVVDFLHANIILQFSHTFAKLYIILLFTADVLVGVGAK